MCGSGGEQKGTSLPTVAREGTVLDRGADREGTNDINLSQACSVSLCGCAAAKWLALSAFSERILSLCVALSVGPRKNLRARTLNDFSGRSQRRCLRPSCMLGVDPASVDPALKHTDGRIV